MYYVCHVMPMESPWHRMVLISKYYLDSKSNLAKKKKKNGGKRIGFFIFITLMPLGKLSFVELN